MATGTPPAPTVHRGRDAVLPPGLMIEDDFITEAEESALVGAVNSRGWCTTLARRTQHYGYRFNYDTIGADPGQSVNETQSKAAGSEGSGAGGTEAAAEDVLPAELDFARLQGASASHHPQTHYNQLTVNEYHPGMGISPHCETHSCFEAGFCSISLLAGIAMRFDLPAGDDVDDGAAAAKTPAPSVSIWLPRRSRVTFTGDVRLVWKHGISKRKTDLVDGEVIARQFRISLTYRTVKAERGCCCPTPTLCDYQNPASMQLPSGRLGAAKPSWWRESKKAPPP
jgi:alkylated DNA repair protein alkB family protein 8